MAGRKRRKIKSLTETSYGNEKREVEDMKDKLDSRTWSDLPIELLELVMSHLRLEDNIRASVVCKRWHEAASSVQAVIQSPWLMYLPKFNNLYELYDPYQRKSYTLELPELYGSRVCYSRDGWLLLSKPRKSRVFFFNPFNRVKIKLPRLLLIDQIAAFSCAPTSADCVVLTIRHVSFTAVAISTCHVGATEWLTVNHWNRLPFVSSIWNKLVFCNGRFYCLSLTGWLGVYDPQVHTWNVLSVSPPRCPRNFFGKNWWKGKFLVEQNGNILVIYTCYNENPIIFKLDLSKTAWEEVKTLDGMTLFANFLSSHSRADLPGTMRNKVYFSKVRFYGKHCISYSVDQGRYYPRKQRHDWSEQDPLEAIWIEPPKDISSFI